MSHIQRAVYYGVLTGHLAMLTAAGFLKSKGLALILGNVVSSAAMTGLWLVMKRTPFAEKLEAHLHFPTAISTHMVVCAIVWIAYELLSPFLW